MPKFRLKLTAHKLDNVPLLSGGGYVRFKLRESVVSRRESTPIRPLQDHSIEWNHEFDTKVKIGIDSKDQMLKDQIVCLDVFFVENASDSRRNENSISPHAAAIHHHNHHSSRKVLLGRVEINVSMFVNQPPDPCRYIMKRSRVNSILQVTTELELVKGEPEFVVPPLKNSLLFGTTSLISSGNQDQRPIMALPQACNSNMNNAHSPTNNNQFQQQHKLQAVKNSIPIATDICAQLYRSSLFTEWQLQQGELPAQLCVDDIFEGGHGWAGDDDKDASKQQQQQDKQKQHEKELQQQQQQQQQEQQLSQRQRRHHKLGLTHHMPAKPNLELGPLRISGFRGNKTHRKTDSGGSNTIAGQLYSSLSSANGSMTDTQLSDSNNNNNNIKPPSRQPSMRKLSSETGRSSPVIVCTTSGCGRANSPVSPHARVFPSFAMKDSHTTNSSFAEFRAGTTTENHVENGIDYNRIPRALEGLLNSNDTPTTTTSTTSGGEDTPMGSPIMSEANAESERALESAGISTEDLHLYRPWKPSHHHNGGQSVNQPAWLERIGTNDTTNNTEPVFGYQHRGVKYSTSKDGRLVLINKKKKTSTGSSKKKKGTTGGGKSRHGYTKKDPYEKLAASAKISDEDDEDSVVPRHRLWTTFTNSSYNEGGNGSGSESDSSSSSSSDDSSSSTDGNNSSSVDGYDVCYGNTQQLPPHAAKRRQSSSTSNNNGKTELPSQRDKEAFDSEWATAERREYIRSPQDEDDRQQEYQSDHDASNESDYEYFQDELRPNLQNWNINLEKLHKIDVKKEQA